MGVEVGGTGRSLRMDSSEARSCAVLCTIRIKAAISGHYLLRDVLPSVFLMAPPTECIQNEATGLHCSPTRAGLYYSSVFGGSSAGRCCDSQNSFGFGPPVQRHIQDSDTTLPLPRHIYA